MEMCPLKDGPMVASEAIVLAISLEQRGFTLRAEDGKLKLTASQDVRDTLTEEERKEIQRLKAHLLAVVSYVQERI